MQKETQRNEVTITTNEIMKLSSFPFQIYALNKIMAALEEAKMSSFITEKV